MPDEPGGWDRGAVEETARRVAQAWAKLPARDPARIDRIAAKLTELWKLEPDQRVGQLIVNVMRHEGDSVQLQDIQLMEDDRFEHLLDAELELQRARHREDRESG